MKRYLFILCLCIFSGNLISQNLLYNDQINAFSIDVLGNDYYIKTDNTLLKSDSLGLEKYTYSNQNSPHLTSFECTDAMNIMVFYQDFGRIVFLDNTLAEKSSAIELFSLGYSDISAVCLSYNNGFWIYDNLESQLIRINNQGQIDVKSNNLNEILNQKILPHKIREYSNQVYILDTLKGLFLFDRYGTFIKQLYKGVLSDFQYIDGKLFVSVSNQILFIPPFGINNEVYFNHNEPIKSFYIRNGWMWILNYKNQLIKFKPQ